MSAFAKELELSKTAHRRVSFEEDSDEEVRQAPARADVLNEEASQNSELMSRAETLTLSFEQAEKGLSHIMGDKIIARWFLKQVDQTMRLRKREEKPQLEHPDVGDGFVADKKEEDYGDYDSEDGEGREKRQKLEEKKKQESSTPGKSADAVASPSNLKSITLKELIEFHLELFLGKVDHQL